MTESYEQWREPLSRSFASGTRTALRVAVPSRAGAALRVFESGGPSGDASVDRFYWEQPTSGRAVAGVGALARVEAEGDDRFAEAAVASPSVLDSLTVVGDEAPAWAGPLLVGGFGFEPSAPAPGPWHAFPALSFVLPEQLYVRDGEQAWLTLIAEPAQVQATDEAVDRLIAEAQRWVGVFASADVDAVLRRSPSTASHYLARPDRPHVEWLAGVEDAVAAMVRGDLEKVVLARSLGVETDVAYDAAKIVSELRSAQRACTTFAVTRGAKTFLGASPERLLRVTGDRLSTAALAGSAPRGRSPEEDERFARGLRESKKEQEEHAFVVREIAAALEPYCEGIERGEAPSLLALDAIQHLETPFEARLRSDREPRPHLFDLAARLHPTPAVCGTPREQAGCWLREHEGLDRGWYAGGIGYVDATGGGDLGVALRSGLIDGCVARLFAGAGLVAASVPEAELAETRLKLRTLLSQLTEI